VLDTCFATNTTYNNNDNSNSSFSSTYDEYELRNLNNKQSASKYIRAFIE